MSAAVTIKDRAMDMEIQQVPWWNRRTRMERRFFILSIILLLATIGLSIALAGVIYKDILNPNVSDNGGRVDFVRDPIIFETREPVSVSDGPFKIKDFNVPLGKGKQVSTLGKEKLNVYLSNIYMTPIKIIN